MPLTQLIALLPCETLETLDLRRKEADAEQLLSAWSSLWHPALLASTRAIPRWLSASSLLADPTDCLIVVPDCCEASLPDGWLSEAEATGAHVLRHLPDRPSMLAAALDCLGADRPSTDPACTADFLALGFCHLQIELMTQKLRYMSSLDHSALQTAVLSAAEASLAGDAVKTQEHLQAAFDRLHEAREYFFPTGARLLDLTLVARTTLGPALQQELADGPPRNLLMSANLLDLMSRDEPATLAAMREAMDQQRVDLIGGEYAESPLPMLDPSAIAASLDRGQKVFEDRLGYRPTVFGRRRFGLTPVLPQVLIDRGFQAAFHCTLDDGQFPTSGRQTRMQWAGLDGTAIDSLDCLPLDAGRATSFLRFAETLGDALSLDHAGTILLAHWPGRSSPWYEDLRRACAYGDVFGPFLTITDYFGETVASEHCTNDYTPDQYRSPYLIQDVAAGRGDPIFRWVAYVRRRAMFEQSQTLDALASLVTQRRPNAAASAEFAALAAAIEDQRDIDPAANKDTATQDLDHTLDERRDQAMAAFARAIAGPSASTARGALIVNPWSGASQTLAPPSGLSFSSSTDVPGLGFCLVSDEAASPSPHAEPRRTWFGRKKSPPPLAEDHVLRNEFFEIHFDPATGGIRTISDYHSRGPRLGQQIALRWPGGEHADAETNYTTMAADDIRVTACDALLGEMCSRGRLLDREGRSAAEFQQITRVRRGSRVIELELALDVHAQPGPNPWDSYYAVRFAWKDETTQLSRDVGLACMSTELMRFESPRFVDLACGPLHTTLLTGGLAYHRRIGLRRLDTLLIAQGEMARKFRLGIGIDSGPPAPAALHFAASPPALSNPPQPSAATGWLFHLDSRNVLAGDWEPLFADEPDGQLVGFRVRLLETDGRGGQLGLRCFRNVVQARQRCPDDASWFDLKVEGDRIHVPIGPYQWIELEGRFAGSENL